MKIRRWFRPLLLLSLTSLVAATARATVDVQPLNITRGSSSVSPGGSLSVSWQIRNNGNTTAGSSNSQVRITTSSSSFGNSGNNVGSPQATGSIGPGATINQSTTVTVPTTPGTYYVWVVADNNSALSQTNTSNDFAVSSSFTVVAPTTVDVQPINISLGSSNVSPGGSLSVSWQIRNNGSGAAGSSNSQVRITTSNASGGYGNGSNNVGSAQSTGTIGAGATVNQGTTVTVPSTPGTYYVWVIADNNSALTQTNTSNDFAVSNSFTVSAPATTIDVQPLNVTLGSSSVAPGTSLSVNWQIRNNGSGTAGSSNSQVRITTSNASGGYGNGSNNVGSAQSTGTIGAGATINQGTTINAPTTPGTYYVWVVADNNSALTQTNTTNDFAVSSGFTVAAAATVDVQPLNVTLGSASVSSGGSLSVSWLIRNNGTGAAATSNSQVRITSSNSSSGYGNGSNNVGSAQATGMIAAGASVSQNATVTVPTTPGTYYVWVVADNNSALTQSDTGNDFAVSGPLTVTAAQAVDVQPISVSLGSSTVSAGGTVTVSWQIRNNGSSSAASSNSQVRITSSNGAGGYGSPSNNVGSAQSTGTIAAGASVSQSATISVPTTPGTYYVWVIADNNSALTQSDVNNDYAVSSALTVAAGGSVDLQPLNVTLGNANATAGGSISVSWQIRNNGTSSAATSNTQLRITSSNSTGGYGGPSGNVGSPQPTGTIAGGATIGQNATLTVPATPGTYYVWVIADNNSVLTQSDTANDYAVSSALTVTSAGSVDVQPIGVTLGAASIASGGTLSVSWQVRNNGTASAATSNSQVRITSSNAANGYGSPSNNVGSAQATGTIAGGATVNQSATVTVPTAPGTYYVWIIADNNSALTQSETNNDFAVSSAFTVTAATSTLANLIPQNITLSSSSPTPGARITVSWTIANVGGGNATATQTGVRITSSATSHSGATLTNVPMPALAAGTSVSQTAAVAVPTAPGTYYVWIIADNVVGSTLQQSDVNDDFQRSAGFTVGSGSPLPNLVPRDIVLSSSSVAPGAPLTVTWNLANTGPGNAAATRTGVRITSSATDYSGTTLTNVNMPALNAGTSTPQTATVNAPSASGTYYVWIIADNVVGSALQQTDANDDFQRSSAFTVTGSTPVAQGEPASLGVIWLASPNFEDRPAGQVIDSIVIHTVEGSYASGKATLRDDTVPLQSRVSAHYIISPDGEITQLVALDKRAWHATYYNDRSIGIEMAGFASQASTWNSRNLEALESLVAYLVQKYNIRIVHPAGDATTYPNNRFTETGLLGHSQIQPGGNGFNVKTDPGPHFPWASFVSDIEAKVNPTNTAVAPIVAAVTQNVRGTNTPQPVTVTGQNFSATVRVRLRNIALGQWFTVSELASVLPTSIAFEFAFPTTGGSWEVEIANPDGRTARGSFNVVAAASEQPDLIVESVSFGVGSANAGSSVNLRFSVRNPGSGRSKATRARVWLTAAQSVSAQQWDLSPDLVDIPAISAGGLINLSNSHNLPRNIPPGNYAATVHVDVDRAGAQSDYSNDVARSGPGLTITTSAVAAPVISSVSGNVAVAAGGSATFRVTATGENLSYLWQKDGISFTAPTGTGSSELRLDNVAAVNAGSYTVTVSNAGGSRTSSAMQLSVTTIPAIPAAPKKPVLRTDGAVNAALPTIVITHGWQPRDNYEEGKLPPWVTQLGKAIQDRLAAQGSGQKVNVIYFHWPEAYTPSLVNADFNVSANGVSLASGLRQLLGDRYAQPMHFFGHSLGTFLNADAIYQLQTSLPNVTQIQATIFDTAFSVPGRNEEFFQAKLPKGRVRWVDNFYGSARFISLTPAVGKPIRNAAPIGGQQTTGDHSGPYEWYLEPQNFSAWFDNSIVLPGFNTNARPGPREWEPDFRPVSAILNELTLPGMLDNLRTGFATGGMIIYGTVVVKTEPIQNAVLTGLQSLGQSIHQVINLKSGAGTQSGSMAASTSHSSAPPRAAADVAGVTSIAVNTRIPDSATTLVLPYRFSAVHAGDWLGVTFNNAQLLAVRSDTIASTDWQRAEISIASLRGASGTLTIQLNSAAGSTAEASVGAATFVSPTVPTVISDPVSTTYSVGETVTLSAQIAGVGPFTYQWRKDGVALVGANGPTLNIANADASTAGTYDVVVRNENGSVTTAAATVAVATNTGSTIGRIVNLSIRANAGTGAQTLIVGFVVGGPGTSGSKALLVRGVGPSLAPFGVTGFLTDPQLSVYSGSSVVSTNDNWGGNGSIRSVAAQLGAFPFASDGSSDSAMYNAAMPAGAYSAQITGAAGTTGVTLAEIYDGTASASFVATTPRLVNVSARTQVGTGGDILITGFVLGGSTPRKLLIRAIGPTLARFGVTGELVDPKLELFSGSERINENDNWGGSAELSSAFLAVGAFGLDASSRDACLLVTLQPGSYSAQVSGVGNTTGVGLVEVYEVP